MTEVVATLEDVVSNPATLTVTGVNCDGVIGFPDETLRRHVAEAVGKTIGDITIDDVGDLTELRVESGEVGQGYAVTDLTGIECLTNLEVLVIDNHSLYRETGFQILTDATPLEALSTHR